MDKTQADLQEQLKQFNLEQKMQSHRSVVDSAYGIAMQIVKSSVEGSLARNITIDPDKTAQFVVAMARKIVPELAKDLNPPIKVEKHSLDAEKMSGAIKA